MLPLFHGIENRAENVVEHTEPVFDEETGELSGPEVFDIRMLAMVHEFRVQGYDMAAECIGGTGLERKPRGVSSIRGSFWRNAKSPVYSPDMPRSNRPSRNEYPHIRSYFS